MSPDFFDRPQEIISAAPALTPDIVGGLTYVMDQLESDGLVTRTYGHADDRRSVVVELTDLGLEFGRSLCSALADSAPEICAALVSLPTASD